MSGLPDFLREHLLEQRFFVGNIVKDSALLETFRRLGADTLRRITVANPCADTLSITRYGDTIRSEDYLWMLLQFRSDTNVNVVQAAMQILRYHHDMVEFAEPNYRLFVMDRIPLRDPDFVKQFSLHRDILGCPRAWDFQVGSYEIKVGVIDDGIWYYHCDLGGNKGNGQKVVGGWNWTENSADISIDSHHGTPVAGIIGALTNQGCMEIGVSGIAGGWGANLNGQGIGVQLFGFRVAHPSSSNVLVLSFIIAAIREASSFNPNTGYGYGVHILNNSYGAPTYSESLRMAVLYAFENGVSFVAARGNKYEDKDSVRYIFPACYDEPWVTNVGASERHLNRVDYSIYAGQMDFIAPGGATNDPIVYTTKFGGSFRWFSGTSAAAPHVSGIIALLRSEAREQGWNLVVEDYEGILKAACLDRQYDSRFPSETKTYKRFYDRKTGWGHVRADSVFEMLQRGYRVEHFSTYTVDSVGEWSEPFRLVILNAGGRPKPIPSGWYLVQKRWLYGHIQLPANRWMIDSANPLFVWGRSGEGKPSGWGITRPCLQVGQTFVLSGYGGNGEVDGIWHSHSLEVRVANVQYKVMSLNGKNMGIYPDPGFHISVFGRQRVSEVKVSGRSRKFTDLQYTVRNGELIVYGQLPQGVHKVTLRLMDLWGRMLRIVRLRGEKQWSCRLALPHLSRGLYYLQLQAGEMVELHPVILVE